MLTGRKKNSYFPKYFLAHKRKLFKTIVLSIAKHKKISDIHKIKNKPHFFQKIKHKDLILLIKSFLTLHDISKIYFEVSEPSETWGENWNSGIENDRIYWNK